MMISSLLNEVDLSPRLKSFGLVIGVRGNIVICEIPGASIGDLCKIQSRDGKHIDAQVISFESEKVTLAPFQGVFGIAPGSKVTCTGRAPHLSIPNKLLGRVLDAFGKPISIPSNNEKSPDTFREVSLYKTPPAALSRKKIDTQLFTGISSIDHLCPLAYGQRLGLFAGAGIGKSTLLGMIARNTDVDVVVVGLIGERGREVNEFISDCLGQEGLKKSVIVVSTSDEPSLMRKIGAYTAISIAEDFRAQGKRVLLLIDSLTRMARAIRDVALSAGEIPIRHGYPPSVYNELPSFLERAGNDEKGSISAIYTILTDSEHESDPLAEEVKSLLDGHLVLSKKIASSGIRPAIDVLNSVSRLTNKILLPEDLYRKDIIIKILSRLSTDKDLIL